MFLFLELLQEGIKENNYTVGCDIVKISDFYRVAAKSLNLH